MRKLSILTSSVMALLLMGLHSFGVGGAPLGSRDNSLNQQLNELSRFGVSYRFLNESTIELRDAIMGWSRVKTLQEPEEAAIRSWAASRGIPVIDIDPTLVDTSQWTGWYEYWTHVPVGNGTSRVPTQAYDFDGNGFPEVYGFFGGVGFADSRVFEVYPDGSSLQRYIYNNPVVGIGIQVVDVDGNGTVEAAFSRGQFTYVYEQPTPTSLPTQLKCAFKKYDGLGAYASVEHLVDMDGDSVMDFVHRGADTSVSQYYLMYVSEYNVSIQNFEKIWYIEPPIPPTGFDFMDGYDVGDYDGDGLMEVIASSLNGKLRIVENAGNNTYAVTVLDSLPLVNMYYQTSGDVDGDGKREFFVGATMGSGNWTVMFESVGDNMYTPRVVLHLLSGGSLDDPTYFTDDVNGDGRLELVILSGGWLYVFKSDADDSYYLWYLKKGPSSFSVNFVDLDGDSIKDLLWSVVRENQYGSDIFRGSPLVSVPPTKWTTPTVIELFQNYPNPFNPTTNIRYILPARERVSLRVFDIAGREVATLVDAVQDAGSHVVQWNTDGVASGVYLYRLRTSRGIPTRKMILLR